MNEVTAILLAAGKGERMKSPLPKVLHTIDDNTLISYVLRELKELSFVKQVIVVTGYKANLVEHHIRTSLKDTKVQFVRQNKLLGTADALRCALPKVRFNNVLVLCADAPLITKDTLEAFAAFYKEQNSFCSLITAHMPTSNDLGKIVRDPLGNIQAIREKVDMDSYGLGRETLTEVNSGIYLFDKTKLSQNLPKVQKNPKKDEYFLTDLISIFYDQGADITTFTLKDNDEIFGINNKKDLVHASKIMRQRINQTHIEQGIKIMDPETTYIHASAVIGQNTIIFPFTFIEKNVIIGNSCTLGPFLHLREGAVIKSNSQLGNFVEVVRSNIGKDVRIKHHSYIGDAYIADKVNIGAGTVIANYDGKRKNKTVIEEGAFIGSDSILVAPVRIGKNAITGAGCVVTKNVAPNSVVAGVPARILKKKR